MTSLGVCRYPGCRQYGKKTVRFNRHLKDVHGATLATHELLPQVQGANVAEECMMLACSGKQFLDIKQHMQRTHKFKGSL